MFYKLVPYSSRMRYANISIFDCVLAFNVDWSFSPWLSSSNSRFCAFVLSALSLLLSKKKEEEEKDKHNNKLFHKVNADVSCIVYLSEQKNIEYEIYV